MTALSTFDSVDEVVFLIMSPMVARRYYSSLTLKYLSCVILVASCLRRRRAPRLDAFSIQGAEYVMHYWLVFFFWYLYCTKWISLLCAVWTWESLISFSFAIAYCQWVEDIFPRRCYDHEVLDPLKRSAQGKQGRSHYCWKLCEMDRAVVWKYNVIHRTGST